MPGNGKDLRIPIGELAFFGFGHFFAPASRYTMTDFALIY